MSNERPFRVIIAGGREYKLTKAHAGRIKKILSKYYDFRSQTPIGCGVELVTGTAGGADQIPYKLKSHYGIPLEEFPADWYPNGQLDRSAGYRRNVEMAEYADALIAFWDGESRGTAHMIKVAKANNLKVKVIHYDG